MSLRLPLSVQFGLVATPQPGRAALGQLSAFVAALGLPPRGLVPLLGDAPADALGDLLGPDHGASLEGGVTFLANFASAWSLTDPARL
jgi:hypothetical protein